jgi:outer membrane PBP1 activator LpoA protein
LKPYTLKLFLFLCISALAACTQPVRDDQPETGLHLSTADRNASLAREAERLLELAQDSDKTTDEFVYRGKAARLYIEIGKTDLANDQLAVMDNIYSSRLADQPSSVLETASATISLLSAEIAIAEQNLVLASELLADTRPVTRQQQIDFYTAKANLDYQSGNYMFAVDRRVQLGSYITTDDAKNRNNQKIWAALSNIPTSQLRKQKSSDPVITGWLDLAKVMRSGQQNISKLEDDLLDWGTRHPDHPIGKTFLSELIDGYQVDTSAQKHIGVILPLDGKLANISSAIKNGLLSAYYSDPNSPIKPLITFYDNSDGETTFYQLYQQAIDDGVTDIIGPLDKVTINQLAQRSELDLPVLTLNYAENTNTDTEDLYQFGLSPADEARQVAELAIRQNRMHAAVFYPDSEWGERLNKAFTEHYEALGGTVLARSDYAVDTNDYRRPIRSMLSLDQSSIRRRKVENIIGTFTKYEPYRRQDIDMIFLAATHRSARGIMPAFKFHHAGNIPVYSTSHIYTGTVNREQDRDLDGLVFCDMPWILQNTSPLYKTFKSNWPEHENYTRLFALGADAYHLIYNLDYLQDKDYAFYEGLTGNIQLTAANQVTRKLLWAEFKKGRPVVFEPAVELQTDQIDTGTRLIQ